MSKKDQHLPASTGQLLIYQTEDGRLKGEARLEHETLWLTQQQMADLFQISQQNISPHLQNIFAEKELAEDSVIKDCLTTASDGKDYRTKHYTLDAILSVGYPVKSAVAMRFHMLMQQQTFPSSNNGTA